jgi:hypothetical protein
MLVNQETERCQKDLSFLRQYVRGCAKLALQARLVLSLVSLACPNTEKRSVSETKRVKLKEDPRAERKEDCGEKLCSTKATRKERKK